MHFWGLNNSTPIYSMINVNVYRDITYEISNNLMTDLNIDTNVWSPGQFTTRFLTFVNGHSKLTSNVMLINC